MAVVAVVASPRDVHVGLMSMRACLLDYFTTIE